MRHGAGTISKIWDFDRERWRTVPECRQEMVPASCVDTGVSIFNSNLPPCRTDGHQLLDLHNLFDKYRHIRSLRIIFDLM